VSAERFQQSGDGPTTPTPYPDGLITHHADGTITYPDAYTGERVMQWGDEWYHSLGFYLGRDSGWEWYGFKLFDNGFINELLTIATWLVLLTWLALPFLPGMSPRHFCAYLGWAGCVTLGTSALVLLIAHNHWEDLELSFPIIPAGLLFWWSSSAATSWRARAWRISLAAVLLLFPWLPLGILASDWYSDAAIWGSICFAAMLPLALSRRADLMQGALRWMVAVVPPLLFFGGLSTRFSGWIISPWVSHAIPMAIARRLYFPRAVCRYPRRPTEGRFAPRLEAAGTVRIESTHGRDRSEM
jgi:hypothetical protein